MVVNVDVRGEGKVTIEGKEYKSYNLLSLVETAVDSGIIRLDDEVIFEYDELNGDVNTVFAYVHEGYSVGFIDHTDAGYRGFVFHEDLRDGDDIAGIIEDAYGRNEVEMIIEDKYEDVVVKMREKKKEGKDLLLVKMTQK